MSLVERRDVPAARSRASTSATDSPREAASSAAPAPVTPPPMMSTSNRSRRSRARSAARRAGESRAAANRETDRSRTPPRYKAARDPVTSTGVAHVSLPVRPAPTPPCRRPPSRWPVVLLRVAAVAGRGLDRRRHGRWSRPLAWLVADVLAATVGEPPCRHGLADRRRGQRRRGGAAGRPGMDLRAPVRRRGGRDRRAPRRPGRSRPASRRSSALARAVPEPHNEALLGADRHRSPRSAALVRGPDPPARRARHRGRTPRRAGLGLAAGLFMLLPWLWVGSLGGLTETVAALAAAAAVGWLAAQPARRALRRLRPVPAVAGAGRRGGRGRGAGPGRRPPSVGGPGVNLAEMVVLPALGFAAAALAASAAPRRRRGRLAGRRPASAAAALGPLAFVDPEETTLLLGLADIGLWTLIGSALARRRRAAPPARAYGLALRPAGARRAGSRPRPRVAVAVAAVAVYGLVGPPGLLRRAALRGHGRPGRPVAAWTGHRRPVASGWTQTYRRLVDHAERTQAPLRREPEPVRPGLPAVLPGQRDPRGRRPGRAARGCPVAPMSTGCCSTSGSARCPSPRPTDARQRAGTRRAATVEHRADPGRPRLGRARRHAASGIVIGTSDSGVDGSPPGAAGRLPGRRRLLVRPVERHAHADRPRWTRHAHARLGAGPRRHRRRPGRAVDRLRQPRPQPGQARRSTWTACSSCSRRSPTAATRCGTGGRPGPRTCSPTRGAARRSRDATGGPCGQAVAALRAAGHLLRGRRRQHRPVLRVGRATSRRPYPEVFTVGAVDRDRTVTDFSSRGPTAGGLAKPDVVAPGADIALGAARRHLRLVRRHVDGDAARGGRGGADVVGQRAAHRRHRHHGADPAGHGHARRSPSYASTGSGRPCGSQANITGAGLVDAYAAVQAAGLRGRAEPAVRPRARATAAGGRPGPAGRPRPGRAAASATTPTLASRPVHAEHRGGHAVGAGLEFALAGDDAVVAPRGRRGSRARPHPGPAGAASRSGRRRGTASRSARPRPAPPPSAPSATVRCAVAPTSSARRRSAGRAASATSGWARRASWSTPAPRRSRPPRSRRTNPCCDQRADEAVHHGPADAQVVGRLGHRHPARGVGDQVQQPQPAIQGLGRLRPVGPARPRPGAPGTASGHPAARVATRAA